MSDFKIDGNLGIGELSPGSTGRRWEPEGGVRKHNEKIHRESNYVDTYGNLPFTFSKPKKSGRKAYMKCAKCGHIVHVSINTVGMVCKECNAYVSVEEV
jgi:DNA-directed RNA polymerase subunit RPC12/RpoP